MNYRRLAAVTVLLVLLAAALLPNGVRFRREKVFHQHLQWSAQAPEDAGVDMYGNLTTHLPLLILKTQGQTIPGALRDTDEVLLCDYAIIANPNGVNHSGDTPTQTGLVTLSVRGNSSRYFPKKQYAMKLVDDNGMPQKLSLLGMNPESTWVLNGSHIDRSQLRNYVMYNICAEIMTYAPRCRLCEVMFTDSNGHVLYQGLYTLIEKPKVSESRLNLTAYNPKFPESSFLLHINTPIEGPEITHLKPDSLNTYTCEVVYPQQEDVTQATLDYIQRELLVIEKALYDADHTGKWEKIGDYLDLESFADYYIINEFFQNYDAGKRSTYLYRDLGGKLCIGPVWDFDGVMNNFSGFDFPVDVLEVKSTFFYYYLTQDTEFLKLVARRYEQLRSTFLAEEYLLDYIDGAAAYAEAAIHNNYEKWYGGDYQAFYDEIEAMKEFIRSRGRWMDEHFIEQSGLVKGKEALP